MLRRKPQSALFQQAACARLDGAEDVIYDFVKENDNFFYYNFLNIHWDDIVHECTILTTILMHRVVIVYVYVR